MTSTAPGILRIDAWMLSEYFSSCFSSGPETSYMIIAWAMPPDMIGTSETSAFRSAGFFDSTSWRTRSISTAWSCFRWVGSVSLTYTLATLGARWALSPTAVRVNATPGSCGPRGRCARR